MGGVVGQLAGKDFAQSAAAGALGAVAAEMCAEMLHDHFSALDQQLFEAADRTGQFVSEQEFNHLSEQQSYQQAEIAKLSAGLVTLLAGQDVDISLKTATNAVENNYKKFLKEALKKQGGNLWKAALKRYQAYQIKRFINRDWHNDIGVPKEWRRIKADKGDGVKFRAHAENGYNEVRFGKGDPKFDMPGRQVDYVKIVRNGQYRDINGNVVRKESFESHIPLKGNEKIIDNLIKQLWN